MGHEAESLSSRSVSVILFAHVVLLAFAATKDSPTHNEVSHLTAGISYLHLGRFGLYRVNPPLARIWAALPVVACAPEARWSIDISQADQRTELTAARMFIEQNQEWLSYVILARTACIPFSLLGAYCCFRWASELYGSRSGIVAALLWSFSPNVVAHGHVVTPDIAASAFGVLAAYRFWVWLENRNWGNCVLAGLALGAAQLTKTTWIVLYVIWPALFFARAAQAGMRRTMLGGCVAQFFAIVMASILTLNVGYGFECTFTRLGDYDFVSTTLTGRSEVAAQPGGIGNRFRDGPLSQIPIPLPKSYVMGIDLQKYDFDEKKWSFLRGVHRKGGWWYYYLYALMLKVPVGTWLVGFIAVSRRCCGSKRCVVSTGDAVLLSHSAAIIALVSSQTGLNHHLRYLLPAFPFAFIFVGRIGSLAFAQKTLLTHCAGAALAWSITSSLWIYPHSLSYFNEFVGGPCNGHNHLGGNGFDSNIDWGQDLIYLRSWLGKHPEAAELELELCIHSSYEVSKIVGSLPNDRISKPNFRWVAINVNRLHDRAGRYVKFRNMAPSCRIGYSICIYNLSEDTDGGPKR